MDFSNKTVFITGGSRGIGHTIAVALGAKGANVAIAAKTVDPHPKLENTIFTAAEDVEEAGGKAFAVQCDVRDEENVENALKSAADHFGGIDILINNASAIFIAPTADMPIKRFDLVNQVNARGTFLCSQKALPYLKNSDHAHILNLAPPPLMDQKWFKMHTGYTISKYGMSMCVMGMAAEFAQHKIGVNGLWPLTTIATAAIKHNFPEPVMQMSRKPQIMADAAVAILSRNPSDCTGNFFVDEMVLREEGVTDFSGYAYQEGMTEFFMDAFIPDDVLAATDTQLINPMGFGAE